MSEEQIKAACPSCENRMFFEYSKALSKQSCSSCNYNFTVPKLFGAYTLQVVKANDEFSTTYNALNKDNELCRLRVFNELITNSLHAQQALKLSVQKQLAINSEHLLKLKESFEFEDQYCIEYDFIKTSLKGYRQKEKLTMDKALALSLDLLKAYKDLSSHELLASNLKPSTITYDKEIISFYDVEISWPAALELSKKTQGFNPVNNSQYVAPEVISERKVSVQSDIYSLGCIIYELFTNYPPFHKEETGNSLLEAHKNIQASSLLDINKNLPENLNRLVLSMLEKKPSYRPEIQDLIQDFERIDLHPSKEILKEFAPSPSDTLVPKKTEEIDLSLLASERNLHPLSSVTPLEEDAQEEVLIQSKEFPWAIAIIIIIILAIILTITLKRSDTNDDRESLSHKLEVVDENYRST
ncbi:protein kinase [Lentisphaera profundi]|uniref:Protein kinase n=1 Tax=Lentisphaera profundi TaxID=1658616 RepID=A0ABY7VTH8_9BACT|nr:protein kinase [Lentisphaera profundi]WDE97503.1 protein kinase [Lentisphaera profundi]